MSRLIFDALTTGLPLIPAVLGIYLVFRLRSDFDLTIDASFAMGGAVAGVLLIDGAPVVLAIAAAIGSTAAMGLLTSALHLLLRIPVILAGLIMSIGFYSVALRVMQRPSLSLSGAPNILDTAFNAPTQQDQDLLTVAIFGGVVLAVLVLVGLLLRTKLGLGMRATGINAPMARAYGVNDRLMLALSLCLANGLAGLSGALAVQGQNFVDVNMGAGTLVAGIGAVLLGDLLIRPAGSKVVRVLLAVLLGGLLYRAILVIALRIGVAATDLKAVTAVILILALALERLLRPLLLARGYRPLLPVRQSTSDSPKETVDAGAR
jgi:putative ABC transport system permease protein